MRGRAPSPGAGKWRAWLIVFGLIGGGPGCGEEAPSEPWTGAGSAAADYLQSDPHVNLTLEVDMMGFVSSSPVVLDVVMGQFNKLLNKPGSVDLVFDAPDKASSPPPGGWDLETISALEAAHRTEYTSGDTAVIYLLYVPGAWHLDTQDSRVLGIAYGPSQMVLFPHTIANVCKAGKLRIDDDEAKALLCPLTEAAAWIHELGHLMGLVNAGVPMIEPHEDAAHPHHDVNENCIMHWSHESGDLATFIEKRLNAGKTSLDVFDQACKDDMKAFAGDVIPPSRP